MRFFLHRGWLGLWLMACAISATAQCCPGALLGRITDANDKPLANALVSIHDSTTKADSRVEQHASTGSDGRYRIPQMMWGPFTLTVTASGFVPLDVQHFGAVIDHDVTKDVVMVRDSRSSVGPSGATEPVTEQRGFVQDAQGNDVAGVHVRLVRNGHEVANVLSDGERAFAFNGPDGFYEVFATRHGLAAYHRILNFHASTTAIVYVEASAK